jgi:hypothetical protein
MGFREQRELLAKSLRTAMYTFDISYDSQQSTTCNFGGLAVSTPEREASQLGHRYGQVLDSAQSRFK